MATLQGESWDLASEYPAADSPEIDADLAQIEALLGETESRNEALSPWLEDGAASALTVAGAGDAIVAARAVFTLVEQAERLLHDVGAYAECILSVDSQHAAAQQLQGRLQAVQKRLANAQEPSTQFLALAPNDVVDAYLAAPEVAPSRFAVLHARKRRHELLSLSHEELVNNLSQDGIHAWGRLYDQLSGTLACAVETRGGMRTVGLAEASGMMLSADEPLRESAWRAINAAWDEHAESCAAAINAIAGWRLEMCRQRSKPRSPRAVPRRAAARQPHHPANFGDGAASRSRRRAARPPRRAPASQGVRQEPLRAVGSAGAGAGRRRWRRSPAL